MAGMRHHSDTRSRARLLYELRRMFGMRRQWNRMKMATSDEIIRQRRDKMDFE